MGILDLTFPLASDTDIMYAPTGKLVKEIVVFPGNITTRFCAIALPIIS